jgi:hypothetical protein
VIGFYNGVNWCEHAHAKAISVTGTITGLLVPTAYHASRIERYLDVANLVGITTSGDHRLDIGQWDIEREPSGHWFARANDLEDASSHLKGAARYAVVLGGTGSVGTFNKNGGTNFTAVNMGT